MHTYKIKKNGIISKENDIDKYRKLCILYYLYSNINFHSKIKMKPENLKQKYIDFFLTITKTYSILY